MICVDCNLTGLELAVLGSFISPIFDFVYFDSIVIGCTVLSMVLDEASLIGIEVYSDTSTLSLLNGFSFSFLSFCGLQLLVFDGI
jgi:hypothetical protein